MQKHATATAETARSAFYQLTREGPITGEQFAERLRETARGIQELRQETEALIGNVAPEEMLVSPQRLAELQERLGTRELPQEFLDAMKEAPDQMVDLSVIQDTMEQTAADVETILEGKRLEELDEGVAGEAILGEEGSSTIDVTSSIQDELELGESLIDTGKLEDVVAHEARHEQQAHVWDAKEVEVDGETLTIKDMVETDAMAQQESIEWVSDDYRRIRERVLRILTEDEVAEVTKTGQLSRVPQMPGRKAA